MSEDQTRLILLIRKIAREEIGEALDEHLCDYEHKEISDEDICT